jgi:biopolymer transport protein ExbD
MRPFRRRRQRTSRIAPPRSGLRLTSMMDILTTLLLFLLKSFVVDGEAMNPPPGLTLPSSTAENTPAASVVIAIDHDTILLGSEKVASLRQAMSSDQMIIAPLSARLQEVQDQMDEIDDLKGTGHDEPRVVTIQGDRDIEFRALQKVMYTVNQTGFDHIALAVIRRS